MDPRPIGISLHFRNCALLWRDLICCDLDATDRQLGRSQEHQLGHCCPKYVCLWPLGFWKKSIASTLTYICRGSSHRWCAFVDMLTMELVFRRLLVLNVLRKFMLICSLVFHYPFLARSRLSTTQWNGWISMLTCAKTAYISQS